ncbi:MAG: hypothetical protein Q8P67_28845, partial [archaeon]|nr:hypothetical protein [archaeon]
SMPRASGLPCSGAPLALLYGFRTQPPEILAAGETISQPHLPQRLAKDAVILCCLDLDARMVSFEVDGVATGPPIPLRTPPGLDPSFSAAVCSSTASPQLRVTLRFDPMEMFCSPAPPPGFFPLQDRRTNPLTSEVDSIAASAEAARTLHGYLTNATPSLPELLLHKAAAHDAVVRMQPRAFEYVSQGGDATSPNLIVADDHTQFSTTFRNVHLLFRPCDQQEFSLKRVIARQPTFGSVPCQRFLFFVCDEVPDFDLFSWTNDFTMEQFSRFQALTQHSARRPHEPVAFLALPHGALLGAVTLPTPVRGRFLVIKLIGPLASSSTGPMCVEHVGLECSTNNHPLADLPEQSRAARAQAIRHQLVSAFHQSTTAWTHQAYNQLIGFVEAESLRLGIAPSLLDCLQLSLTSPNLPRFPLLFPASLEDLQMRFSLVKHLNRLVTPLINHINLLDYVAPASSSSSPAAIITRSSAFLPISAIIKKLKSFFFLETKKSVFDEMLAMTSQRTKGTVSYRVLIDRISAVDEPSSSGVVRETVFEQLFNQLRVIPPSNFNIGINEQPFSVQLKGEGSIDVGVCTDCSLSLSLFLLLPILTSFFSFYFL